MLGDQLDLRIMVGSARVLCDLDISDDFEKEIYVLHEASRVNLAAAAKQLVWAFIAAERAHRSEFRLVDSQDKTFVRVSHRVCLASFWLIGP